MISKTAVVEMEAIGPGTRIEDFAVVRANGQLGETFLFIASVALAAQRPVVAASAAPARPLRKWTYFVAKKR